MFWMFWKSAFNRVATERWIKNVVARIAAWVWTRSSHLPYQLPVPSIRPEHQEWTSLNRRRAWRSKKDTILTNLLLWLARLTSSYSQSACYNFLPDHPV